MRNESPKKRNKEKDLPHPPQTAFSNEPVNSRQGVIPFNDRMLSIVFLNVTTHFHATLHNMRTNDNKDPLEYRNNAYIVLTGSKSLVMLVPLRSFCGVTHTIPGR